MAGYRISKVEWYRRGGFRNSDLFRRDTKTGWRYFAGAAQTVR